MTALRSTAAAKFKAALKMINNPFISALKEITNKYATYDADIPSDNGVLVLTQANFKQAISKYDPLLVKFYMPLCPRCKLFGNEYAKIAQLLSAQHSKIKLGKVDAESEKTLIKQYKVTGYPAIKLFKKGDYVDYYGVKNADYILAWLKRKYPE